MVTRKFQQMLRHGARGARGITPIRPAAAGDGGGSVVLRRSLRIMAAALLLCVPPAWAESTLTLPLPNSSGIPSERVALTIKVPPKVEPQTPPSRFKLKPAAWSSVDLSPFKTVPRKKFVYGTLRSFQKKGLLPDRTSAMVLETGMDSLTIAARMVARLYERLTDAYQKGALRKIGVTVQDLENFQQVVDLMAKQLDANHYPSIEVARRIDEMLLEMRKTSGEGQIRIIEVAEQKDGSTVLKLEISRNH